MGFDNTQYEKLSKTDMAMTLEFMRQCLAVCSEDEFHQLILDFSSYLGFEYILLCNARSSYSGESLIYFDNLSNPADWMAEYDDRDFLHHDPVRFELERRLAVGNNASVIVWDAYDVPLSHGEQEVIKRRSHYGLKYGCSVYHNSDEKDKFFLISFGSRENKVDERLSTVAELVISHLMVARKKLDMLELVSCLTEREKNVAEWLCTGKTNWEIASILGISERTVKYHTANIFKKLNVDNRQKAVAILQAVRFLCV